MSDVESGGRSGFSRRKFLASSGLGLVTGALLNGCQTPQKLEVTQSGAPMFERFRAEYRFQQADRLLSRKFEPGQDEDAAGALRRVSAETSWSHARLDIECPHPGGDPALALLTLTLSDRRGPTSFIRKDARELTIDRSDIELLISDLAKQNFFEEISDGSGNTQLAVQIDRGRIDRGWFNDPRLLDLARRTLAEGSPAAL